MTAGGTHPTAARPIGSRIGAQSASRKVSTLFAQMNPIIGITTRQPVVKTPGGDREAHVVDRVYTDVVMRSGGIPILVSPVAPDDVTRILGTVDGLILSGGGDIDPSFYGSQLPDNSHAIDRLRDEFEFALVREAQRRHMPTLAICRGLQVINVALGGDLIEDIPSEIGSIDHEVRGPTIVDCHQNVTIEPTSAVAKAIGRTQVAVNSVHHQAVRTVAPGLVARGWTDDGVIEVLEAADDNWPLLAVQWHPEYLAVKDDQASLALFATLVRWATATAD